LLDEQGILVRRLRDGDQPAGHDSLPCVPRCAGRVSVLAAETRCHPIAAGGANGGSTAKSTINMQFLPAFSPR
jgi:hypothetical protein